MNKAKRTGEFAPPAVGGTSLLVMFAVLCLTTFAVLSLSTVKAGDRLATASAEAVTEYYAADLEAERILSRLRSGEIPEGVIAVKVRVEGDAWEILQWKVVSSVDWEADETIDVWDGQLPSQQ